MKKLHKKSMTELMLKFGTQYFEKRSKIELNLEMLEIYMDLILLNYYRLEKRWK